MNLRSIDLNLLVILDALLRDGGVTGAARRLNLTQPAVSVALARARMLFGDPLLVRSGAVMRPTPFAEDLAPRLTEALAEVVALFGGRDFEPATSTRSFLLTTSDLAELLILPRLMERLRSQASRITLTLRSGLALESEDSLRGQVDLSIGGLPDPGPPFETEPLFEDDFIVLARHDHPAFETQPDIYRFAALPQALVAPQGRLPGGPIDDALAERGLTRFVSLTLTNFAALPSVVANSDLVACIPRALATLPNFAEHLQVHALPFESPRYTFRQVWHRRHSVDPSHIWLRALIRSAGESV